MPLDLFPRKRTVCTVFSFSAKSLSNDRKEIITLFGPELKTNRRTDGRGIELLARKRMAITRAYCFESFSVLSIDVPVKLLENLFREKALFETNC